LRIWVDGDACPNKIKNIIFKAAVRTQTHVIIVANHFANIPPSPFIKRMKVASGFDVADEVIIKSIEKNDLVVTSDIPLADSVITRGAFALTPRGERYTVDNIKQATAVRGESRQIEGIGSTRPSESADPA
jgi:uncharacterized protein YaiI (UPF0178 family)